MELSLYSWALALPPTRLALSSRRVRADEDQGEPEDRREGELRAEQDDGAQLPLLPLQEPAGRGSVTSPTCQSTLS